MFKKLALIVLFFISNVYASDDTQHVRWTKRVKHSPALVKVFAAIVPCIVTFITMNKVMVNCKDDDVVVNIAYGIKWTAAAIASIFGNLLMKVNFKRWLNRNSLKSGCKKCHDINESEPALIQS